MCNHTRVSQSGSNARQLVHESKADAGESNQCNQENRPASRNPAALPAWVSGIINSALIPPCLFLLAWNLFYFTFQFKEKYRILFSLLLVTRAFGQLIIFYCGRSRNWKLAGKRSSESNKEQTDIMMFTSALLLHLRLLLSLPNTHSAHSWFVCLLIVKF